MKSIVIKDGDTFINHYTHFCHTIGYAITENLIKELKRWKKSFISNNLFIFSGMILLVESLKQKMILLIIIVFYPHSDGYFDGEIETIKGLNCLNLHKLY